MILWDCAPSCILETSHYIEHRTLLPNFRRYRQPGLPETSLDRITWVQLTDYSPRAFLEDILRYMSQNNWIVTSEVRLRGSTGKNLKKYLSRYCMDSEQPRLAIWCAQTTVRAEKVPL
jgi:hypothetical protein